MIFFKARLISFSTISKIHAKSDVILQGEKVVIPIRKTRGDMTSECVDVSFVESKQWFDLNIRQAVAG